MARLIATATPTEAEPPSAAVPSATAVASVLAEEVIESAPLEEVIVTALGTSAEDNVSARLMAIAAAIGIGPEDPLPSSEVSAEGVGVEPELPVEFSAA